MGAHHELAPSAAHRWIACPGSVAACRGLPDSPSSKYSREGTAAHELASFALDNGVPPTDLIGNTITVEGEAFAVDDSMAHHVGIYTSAVMEAAIALGAQMLIEQRIDLSDLAPDMAGASDAVLIGEDLLEVHDLKYGQGVQVSATGNEQLMLYAWGAFRELARRDPEHAARVDRIALVIHQPRRDWHDRWELSVDALHEAIGHIYTRIGLAYGDNPPLVPGESQCHWCPAFATCAAARNAVATATGAETQDFADLDEAARAGAAMSMVGFVESWAEAVRERTRSLLTNGHAVAGWKLVAGRAGARTWADEPAVEDVMKKSFRLKDDDMYRMKLISPTDAEKRFGDQPRRWARLQEFIKRGATAPSIVPDTDKRPALSIDEGFTNLENPQ